MSGEEEDFTTLVRYIGGDRSQEMGVNHPVQNTVEQFLELVKSRLFPKEMFANDTLVAVFNGNILDNTDTIYRKAEIYVIDASRMDDRFFVNALRYENFEHFMVPYGIDMKFLVVFGEDIEALEFDMTRKVITFRKQALQLFLGRDPSTTELDFYRFNFFVEDNNTGNTTEHLLERADDRRPMRTFVDGLADRHLFRKVVIEVNRQADASASSSKTQKMDDKKIELNGKINGLLGVIPPSVPHADELGNLVNLMRNNSEKWVSSTIEAMDMKQFEKLYETYWSCSYSDVSRVSEAIAKDVIPLYQKFNDIIVQANNAIKIANNAKGLMEALLTHAYLCEFGGKANVDHSTFEEMMEQKLKKIEKEKVDFYTNGIGDNNFVWRGCLTV
ncbi:unnamed protein product [Symbiodinium sp. CCMP2592]|nr:unnamed protein product [Symbiodinium sp. CCMP2592]